MSKKVISKGYTVEVTSWENDGDNYKTKSVTYDTKEEALAVKALCLSVFNSCNNGDAGIGNMCEDEDPTPIIVEYVVQHPEILAFSNNKNLVKPSDIEESIKKAFPEEMKTYEWQELIHDYIDTSDNGEAIKNGWYDLVMNYNYELLGGSEYYVSRIAEKVSIFYSDKDIYLEEITE
tara:strand:- start:163 stop:693 length:531 start_codon:yes stop_codon:yes gene_type:complete